MRRHPIEPSGRAMDCTAIPVINGLRWWCDHDAARGNHKGFGCLVHQSIPPITSLSAMAGFSLSMQMEGTLQAVTSDQKQTTPRCCCCCVHQLMSTAGAGEKNNQRFITVSGCRELEARGVNSLAFKMRPVITLLSYQRMSASQQHDLHNHSKYGLRSEE